MYDKKILKAYGVQIKLVAHQQEMEKGHKGDQEDRGDISGWMRTSWNENCECILFIPDVEHYFFTMNVIFSEVKLSKKSCIFLPV